MKYFALALCFMVLSGCGYSTNVEQAGYKNINYKLACIDNVTYVTINKGISVKLDTDGKIVPCR